MKRGLFFKDGCVYAFRGENQGKGGKIREKGIKSEKRSVYNGCGVYHLRVHFLFDFSTVSGSFRDQPCATREEGGGGF